MTTVQVVETSVTVNNNLFRTTYVNSTYFASFPLQKGSQHFCISHLGVYMRLDRYRVELHYIWHCFEDAFPFPLLRAILGAGRLFLVSGTLSTA